MAITNIKNPSSFNFSKNPIPIVLSADNFIQTARSAFSAKLYLQGALCASNALSGAVALAEFFEFAWEGKYMKVIATAVPDTSGFQIPSGDGSLAHANAIKTALLYNKVLTADFTVTVVDDAIDIYILFAQNRSEIYPAFSFTQETTIFISSPEVAAVLRPNFKIFNEYFVKFKTDASFNKIITRFDYIDSLGKLKLDAKEVLNPLLSFDRPTGKESNIVICTKSIAKFYFLLTEFYGTNPELQQLKWSSEYYVVRGGLSRQQFPGNAYFSQYLSNKYLTWTADNRLVKKDQPNYLCYLLRAASIAQVKLKIETTYSVSALATKYLPPVDVVQYDKLLIPCGYTQLNIGSEHPAEKVISFKVTVVKTDNSSISESRTFKVDYAHKPFSRYFIYESSLGAAESLHLYGKVEASVDFEYDNYEIEVPADYAGADGQIQETDIKYTKGFEINTGFVISKTEFEGLIDFFISTEKFYYDPLKKELVPIQINSKSIKLYKDDDLGLYKAKFDYSYRFNDNNYSLEGLNLNPDNGDIGDIDDGGDEE